MARPFSARSAAAPEIVWSLVARPDRWHEWSPHVRGAWGLGTPEVQAGRRGLVRLLGVVPLPATVTDVQPGRSWTWRVGPMTLVHTVTPCDGGGAEVTTSIAAPGPLEGALAATYGPVVALLMRRLARVAERA